MRVFWWCSASNFLLICFSSCFPRVALSAYRCSSIVLPLLTPTAVNICAFCFYIFFRRHRSLLVAVQPVEPVQPVQPALTVIMAISYFLLLALDQLPWGCLLSCDLVVVSFRSTGLQSPQVVGIFHSNSMLRPTLTPCAYNAYNAYNGDSLQSRRHGCRMRHEFYFQYYALPVTK